MSSLTTTSSQPSPPPSPPLLICPRILNPSLNSITHTLSVPRIRHLLLHQQVVGLEKAGATREQVHVKATGSCPDQIPSTHHRSPSTFCSPRSWKGLFYFDIDARGTGKKKKKHKIRNAICADEIKKCQRACKIIWPWKKEWHQDDKACDKSRTEAKRKSCFLVFHGRIRDVIRILSDVDTLNQLTRFMLKCFVWRDPPSPSISKTILWFVFGYCFDCKI